MRWQQFVGSIYQVLEQNVAMVLEGLTPDELNQRPAPDANTIGWLLWHATRSLDRTVGDMALGEQLWIREKWYARFGREADPRDSGFGHTPEDVGRFRIPDGQTLLAYHRAVVGELVKYVAGLNEADLDVETDFARPGNKIALHARLARNFNDAYQHLGQAAYARGLIKGQGWLGH